MGSLFVFDSSPIRRLMNLGDIYRLARRNTKQHFPLILSAAAGAGTLATAYLAGKASFEAARLIDKNEELEGFSDDPKQRLMDRTKLVWKLYIPTAASAVTTIACIIGANRVEVKKTIAAQTAFAVSERVYSEYRDKVIEEYGERKDQSIRDKIADDRIKSNPPSRELVIAGSGEVLCYETFTGRYFMSNMETLARAQNKVNQIVLMHDYCTLNRFYDEVGLTYTAYSHEIGWTSGRLMELEFTSVLTDDSKPALAFSYNYYHPM